MDRKALFAEIASKRRIAYDEKQQKCVEYFGMPMLLQEDDNAGVAGCVWDCVCQRRMLLVVYTAAAAAATYTF
jgi:hypothetical protein